MEKKRIVFIDAMAIAYRAYFAFINRPLTNSKGEPTSAVYGFLTQLFKIIEDTSPDYLAIASDSKEKTFRHDMYDKYKSSRSEMPEDMVPQIHKIKEIIEAFNIPLYIRPGYEADDLIGTAAKMCERKGMEVFAVTPDKDYVQLITENIFIVKPGKSVEDIQIIDTAKAIEQYGFEPQFMVDYLALVGDSSDDIPGVPGVGPKTAGPLIRQFGTIENIYENLESIEKKGLYKKLAENKESAFLSKKLATIVTDMELDLELEKAKFGKPDTQRLLKIFAELDFKNLRARLDSAFGISTGEFESEVDDTMQAFDPSKVDYKLIENPDEARELAKQLSKSELFVFDTETDGLNVFTASMVGVAFCIKPAEAFYVPVNPEADSAGTLFAKDLSDRIPIDEFVEIFKPVFENTTIKKVCQNGKFDIAIMRHAGISVRNFYFDTMLASYVIDPDQKHGMDALAKFYLNYTPIALSDLIGKKKNASLINEAELNELSNYSCEDADITFRLYEHFAKKLKEENLEKLAYEVEFPLVEVLEEMEHTGVKIDTDGLNEFSKMLEFEMEKSTSEIFSLAGIEFNINSTKQLQEILFEKLQLPKTKKTKTGFSTDARSLESLRGKHEIIDHLLAYRQFTKLKSTYADSLPKMINPQTERIHTSFNQTIAATGRLSSVEPNLQNIPIRTELGKEIRKAFIPSSKDHVILSADYSQIELRIMAHICDDPGLKEAFRKGEDIHLSTAALVFQVPPEEVTPDMRRKAKEVNFGILYGIGAFGLKTRLGIPQAQAQEIIDTYFETFKNVKNFVEESKEFAREHGYCQTLLGRRRFLKNINSKNYMMRQFEERVAINMPIQGTAADMIKLAMINIHRELKKQKFESKMVLQVHDELLFDSLKSELDDLIPLVKKLMENALPLSVPIIAETGIGNNWLEAH